MNNTNNSSNNNNNNPQINTFQPALSTSLPNSSRTQTNSFNSYKQRQKMKSSYTPYYLPSYSKNYINNYVNNSNGPKYAYITHKQQNNNTTTTPTYIKYKDQSIQYKSNNIQSENNFQTNYNHNHNETNGQRQPYPKYQNFRQNISNSMPTNNNNNNNSHTNTNIYTYASNKPFEDKQKSLQFAKKKVSLNTFATTLQNQQNKGQNQFYSSHKRQNSNFYKSYTNNNSHNVSIDHLDNRLASSQVTYPQSRGILFNSSGSQNITNIKDDSHIGVSKNSLQSTPSISLTENINKNLNDSRHSFFNSYSNNKTYQYMTLQKGSFSNTCQNFQNYNTPSTYCQDQPRNASLNIQPQNPLRATFGSPTQKGFQQFKSIEKLQFSKKPSRKNLNDNNSGSSSQQNQRIRNERRASFTLRQTLKKEVSQVLQNTAIISSMKNISDLSRKSSSYFLEKIQSVQTFTQSDVTIQKLNDLKSQLTKSRDYNGTLQKMLKKSQDTNQSLNLKILQLATQLSRTKQENQSHQKTINTLNKKNNIFENHSLTKQQYQQLINNRLVLNSQNRQLKTIIQKINSQKQQLDKNLYKLKKQKQQRQIFQRNKKTSDDKVTCQINILKQKYKQINDKKQQLKQIIKQKQQKNLNLQNKLQVLNVKNIQIKKQLIQACQKLDKHMTKQRQLKSYADKLQNKVQNLLKELQIKQFKNLQDKKAYDIQLYKNNQLKYQNIIKQNQLIYETKIKQLENLLVQKQNQKQKLLESVSTLQQRCLSNNNDKSQSKSNSFQDKISNQNQQNSQKYWQSLIDGQLIIQQSKDSENYRTLIRIPMNQQISGQQESLIIKRKQISSKDVLNIVISQCLSLGLKLTRAQSSQNKKQKTNNQTNSLTQNKKQKLSQSPQILSKSKFDQQNIFYLQKQILELQNQIQKKNLQILQKQDENNNLIQSLKKISEQNLIKSNQDISPNNQQQSCDQDIKSFKMKLNNSINSSPSINQKRKGRLIQRDKDKLKNRKSQNILLQDQQQKQQNTNTNININKQEKPKRLSRSRSKRVNSYKSDNNTPFSSQSQRYSKKIIEQQKQINILKQKLEKYNKLTNELQQQIQKLKQRQNNQIDIDFYEQILQNYSQVLQIFNVQWQPQKQKYIGLQSQQQIQLSNPPHQQLLQAINNFTKRIQNLMQSLNTLQIQVTNLTDQNMMIKQQQAHILKKCQFMISNAQAQNDQLVNKYDRNHRKLDHAHSVIIMLQKMLKDSNDDICLLRLTLLNKKQLQMKDNQYDYNLNNQLTKYQNQQLIQQQQNQNQQDLIEQRLFIKKQKIRQIQIKQQENQQQQQQINDYLDDSGIKNPLSPASGQVSYKTIQHTVVKKKQILKSKNIKK